MSITIPVYSNRQTQGQCLHRSASGQLGWSDMKEATDLLQIKVGPATCRPWQPTSSHLARSRKIVPQNLLAAGSDGDAFGDKPSANGWPEAIHRKMRGRYLARFGDGCETACSVQQSCNHARMKMTRVLSMIIVPLHNNFGCPVCRGSDLEPSQEIQPSRGI
jgi:hypothetical protein